MHETCDAGRCPDSVRGKRGRRNRLRKAHVGREAVMGAETALAIANAIVATLNLNAYRCSRETRDLLAAVAWFGSTLYWMLRGNVA